MRVIARIFSAVLAAALAALAFVALVEIILAAFSQDGWLVDSDDWFDTLTEQTWSSSGLRLALAAAGAIGLLFLLVAWAPRRTPAVAARDATSDDVAVTVRRRDAEALLQARLATVPYVNGADAHLTADRVEVTAHATRNDPATEAAVRRAVDDCVDRLALGGIERRVRVRHSARRVA
jgi:hypothetical protein